MDGNIEEKDIKTKEKNDESVIYELGYHLVSSLGDENVPSEVGKIKSVIEKQKGIFISEEFPVSFRLAYTFVVKNGGKNEKHDTSYFGWVKFELPIGSIKNIKEFLDSNKNILRFLITRTVREDTRIPKKALLQDENDEDAKKEPAKTIPKPKVEEKDKKPVSEEELDRTIEELVVE